MTAAHADKFPRGSDPELEPLPQDLLDLSMEARGLEEDSQVGNSGLQNGESMETSGPDQPAPVRGPMYKWVGDNINKKVCLCELIHRYISCCACPTPPGKTTVYESRQAV